MPDSTNPVCMAREYYINRMDGGVWYSSNSILNVSGIEIWTSEAAFNNAPNGDQKKLIIITGGANSPGEVGNEYKKIWLQREAVIFTKTCN